MDPLQTAQAFKFKPNEIRASTLAPIKELTWEHVLVLLKSGFSIRCCGSHEDAMQELDPNGRVTVGDSTAIAAGFPYIIDTLEKAHKIEEVNPNRALSQVLIGTEGQNVSMIWLMREIVEANLKVDGRDARAVARTKLVETLNKYTVESRAVIAAAVYAGLEMTIMQVGKREVTAWAFVVGKMNAIDTKQNFGFGKNGRRGIEAREFWPYTILLAERDATSGQVLAGLLMIAQDIATH